MSDTSPDSTPSRSGILFISILIAATLAGLWWFQQSRIRPFIDTSDPRFFQASEIDRFLQPILNDIRVSDDQVLMLHFWKPDCLCNKISQRHFTELTHSFSPEELHIVIVAHPDTSEQQLDDLKSLNADRLTAIRAPGEFRDLPASPSLSLYGNNGLAYFGPYGFGAFCNVREEGFLGNIIKGMQITNDSPAFINVIGDGCFCSWDSATESG